MIELGSQAHGGYEKDQSTTATAGPNYRTTIGVLKYDFGNSAVGCLVEHQLSVAVSPQPKGTHRELDKPKYRRS